MSAGLIVKGLITGVAVAAMMQGGPAPDDVVTERDRPTGPVTTDTCRGCHTEVTDHTALHGPVVVNACDACHEVESDELHTYRLAREGTNLCTFCHDVDLDAPFIHAPLTTGACLECHDPHGGTSATLLSKATVDELCVSCHDDVSTSGTVVHGPVAAGACSVCHTPHTSSHPGLLTRPSRDLCLDCHVSLGTQLEEARVVHGPAAVDCGACHDPHASDHGMMLREESQALCITCHESIGYAVDTAATKHSAVTTERKCLNCHDPHASDHPRVLISDTQTLCFECHDREIELPDGTRLADIKTVIETGTSLHGPVAQSNCAACHMIHGGDNFRLLMQEYPPEFYAPFAEESYALCFSCHDKQLVHDEKTTALTDFRNGETNLHFLHVNRDKKGRTCRACHETHASDSEKHIRESVPFGKGGWALPIGFEKTASGGSCSPGCHKPVGYDRDRAVVYDEDGGGAIWPNE